MVDDELLNSQTVYLALVVQKKNQKHLLHPPTFPFSNRCCLLFCHLNSPKPTSQSSIIYHPKTPLTHLPTSPTTKSLPPTLRHGVQRAVEVEGGVVVGGGRERTEVPQVNKYLVWGTTGECMKYLASRGQENEDAVERTRGRRRARCAVSNGVVYWGNNLGLC